VLDDRLPKKERELDVAGLPSLTASMAFWLDFGWPLGQLEP
jgi:hypothetical protein